ncbi:unnamed protein product [Enterobius vermicularis]|uniref:Epoxide hydrolase n=1 Tax=Enterobius vermicularis TaxID=51028 RepID=A0A0N4V7S1_ENTVE|nr:unnamed protein product [Enterobius vermicularis]
MYFSLTLKKSNTKISFVSYADLKERLERSRLPESLENSDTFEYGFSPSYLKEVIDYWKNSYDWKKWEKTLNQFPQFTTSLEGLRVHFIHVKPPPGKYKKTFPLLISHGWPGNVFEFYKILPMLSDPITYLGHSSDYAFEVIAPSIPGFGWSSHPAKKGFDQWAVARIFRKLMLRLGHRRFFVQGGDWGAVITKNIAIYYAESVLGLHLNLLQVPPHSNFRAAVLTVLGFLLPPATLFSHPGSFIYGIGGVKDLFLQETGYFHIQATKPDTVGIGLTDSPAGLAAYILEKFSTGTARHNRYLPDGGLTKKFSLDELLTVVTIYWINGNIVYSQRFYKEYTFRAYVSVPTGLAAFPNEMLYGAQPKEILQTAVNLTRYTEMRRGGHFAALEEPKLLAKDVFDFVDEIL